jgi:hypothetical protein
MPAAGAGNDGGGELGGSRGKGNTKGNSKGKRLGKGSSRVLKAEARDLPTLSTLKKMGGLSAVRLWTCLLLPMSSS